MKRGLGAALRVFTIVLLVVTGWTAYANVFSDDTALRAAAGELARQRAGCGDKCKLTRMQGDRGMLETEVAYDFEGRGRFVVTCRRAYVAVGDYDCKVEAAP